MIRRRLPQDMYNRCTTFLYGSVEEINRTLKRECPREFVPLLPSCRGHWHAYPHNGRQADYICVVKGGRRDYRMAVLAHEALHLVVNALDIAGVRLTGESEEAYTYYQQWIVTQCARLMP